MEDQHYQQSMVSESAIERHMSDFDICSLLSVFNKAEKQTGEFAFCLDTPDKYSTKTNG